MGFRASAYARGRRHTWPFRPPVFHSHTFRKTLRKRKEGKRDWIPRPQTQRRTDVGLAAVENGLVAAHVLGDVCEGLYDAEAELLSLHLTGDGDVLDVSDAAEPAQKFALNKDAASANDSIGFAGDDDEDVVRRGLAAHGIELSRPRFCAHVWRLGQHGEHGEVPALVVRRSQRADLRKQKKTFRNASQTYKARRKERKKIKR